MKNAEIIDETKLVWKEFKSKKGVPYSVGYLEDEIEHIEKMILEESAAPELQNKGSIGVYWPVSTNVWKDPGDKVKNDARISKYKVHQNGDGKGIWGYELNIHNTKRNVTYHFTDESGDTYKIWCYWKRDHYLLYNSVAPTIILVQYDF